MQTFAQPSDRAKSANPQEGLVDWSADVVAHADCVEKMELGASPSASSDTHNVIIEISGNEPKEIGHLARYLGSKLSLPNMGGVDTESLVRKIDRRLKLMATTGRCFIVVLHAPDKLPPQLFKFLTTLIARTQLRLLVVGPSSQTEPLKEIAKTAGLGWQDISLSAAPVQNGRIHRRRQWAITGGCFVAFAIAGLGYWYQSPNPAVVTEAQVIEPYDRAHDREVLKDTSPERVVQPQPQKPPEIKPEQPAPKPQTSTQSFPEGTQYTIQIGSYRSKAVRSAYLAKITSRYPQITAIDDVDPVNARALLVYGAFTDYATAEAAIDSLPEFLTQNAPYVVETTPDFVAPSLARTD